MGTTATASRRERVGGHENERRKDMRRKRRRRGRRRKAAARASLRLEARAPLSRERRRARSDGDISTPARDGRLAFDDVAAMHSHRATRIAARAFSHLAMIFL